VRVLPEFVGERLIMTEHYRHKMIDNLRTTAPDPDSRKNPEWVVRLTIDALGVKVIPDVNRIGSRCSGQQLTAVASSKADASDSRVGKSQEWRIFRTILGRR